MVKKRRLLPFGILPAHWGLSGTSRSIAFAEYYYKGEELERRLAEIKLADYPDRLAVEKARIDLKYHRITQYEHDRKVLEATIDDPVEQQVALLDLDHKHGKITQTERDKAVATQRNEPYVGVLSSNFDPNLNVNGLYFELDWNDQFIQMLQESGYIGLSDEMVVSKWFDDICRSVAESAEFAEPDDIEHPPRVVRRDDGRTEHS